MFLADHFSRAAQHETLKSEKPFQVFSLKLETLDPMLANEVQVKATLCLDRMAIAKRGSTNLDS